MYIYINMFLEKKLLLQDFRAQIDLRNQPAKASSLIGIHECPEIVNKVVFVCKYLHVGIFSESW